MPHTAPIANALTAAQPASDETVVIDGYTLSIADVQRVAQRRARVEITRDPATLQHIQATCDYIAESTRAHKPIYGVTTGFGGMANTVMVLDETAALQSNLVWYHKAAAGARMPEADVRAAMLLRANSHLHGISGIRLEIIQRLITFLNANVIPHVYDLGSIGASGDLLPLSYITGALLGLSKDYGVDFDGEPTDALTALERLGLPRLDLLPKEGLAMINGTSMMAGVAANNIGAAKSLLALALGAHALMIQALVGTNQSFHPFIHAHKPHPGQRRAAASMLALLDGSQMIRDELDGQNEHRGRDLIQDRYSLRCLPQYIGPLIDSMAEIERQIEVEINSATDNPLLDAAAEATYHGGNFLGQYVGLAMDRLRYIVSMLAQHLDTQIALLVTPEFNRGLPPCLIGNTDRRINMGLKGLQISGNSMVPMLAFLGNSITDRFPTHAEQFNQNINSQGFNSANLARQSLTIFRSYVAVALIFGVQGVDLRTYELTGQYDARRSLSPATARLYEAVRTVIGRPPAADRPYMRDDTDFALDADIARIAADIAADGPVAQAAREFVLA